MNRYLIFSIGLLLYCCAIGAALVHVKHVKEQIIATRLDR